MLQNPTSAVALPQTPLRELTALPTALAGFNVPTSKTKEGERREGSGGYKGVPGRPWPL